MGACASQQYTKKKPPSQRQEEDGSEVERRPMLVHVETNVVADVLNVSTNAEPATTSLLSQPPESNQSVVYLDPVQALERCGLECKIADFVYMGTNEEQQQLIDGCMVTHVPPNSVAARIGLRKNDIITCLVSMIDNHKTMCDVMNKRDAKHFVNLLMHCTLPLRMEVVFLRRNTSTAKFTEFSCEVSWPSMFDFSDAPEPHDIRESEKPASSLVESAETHTLFPLGDTVLCNDAW